jgi:hypothetical protein
LAKPKSLCNDTDNQYGKVSAQDGRCEVVLADTKGGDHTLEHPRTGDTATEVEPIDPVAEQRGEPIVMAPHLLA